MLSNNTPNMVDLISYLCHIQPICYMFIHKNWILMNEIKGRQYLQSRSTQVAAAINATCREREHILSRSILHVIQEQESNKRRREDGLILIWKSDEPGHLQLALSRAARSWDKAGTPFSSINICFIICF